MQRMANRPTKNGIQSNHCHRTIAGRPIPVRKLTFSEKYQLTVISRFMIKFVKIFLITYSTLLISEAKMTDKPAELLACRFVGQENSPLRIQVNRWEYRPTNRPTDRLIDYTQQQITSKGGNRIQQGINNKEQLHGKTMHRNESGLKGDMLT